MRPALLVLLAATGCRAILGIDDAPDGPGGSEATSGETTTVATGAGAGTGAESSSSSASGAAQAGGGAGDGGGGSGQGGAGGEIGQPAGGGSACDPPSGGGAAPCSPCGAVECCIDCDEEAGRCRQAEWMFGGGEALSRIAIDGDQVIVERSGVSETTLDWLRADGDDPSPHASVVLPTPSVSSLSAADDRVYLTSEGRVQEIDACGGVRVLAEDDFVTALRREDRVYAVHRSPHAEGEVACLPLDGRPCAGFAGGPDTGLFGGLAFDDDENPWWSMYEPGDQGPVWLVGLDGPLQVSAKAEEGTIELRDVTMVGGVPTVFAIRNGFSAIVADATELDCVFSIAGAANIAALEDPDLGPLVLLPHAQGLMICKAGVEDCKLHETGAVEGIAVGEGAVFYTEGPRLHRLQRGLRDVYDDALPFAPCE